MIFSFVGLTPKQVGVLPTSVFAHLSPAQLAELTAAQAATLSGSQIAAIPAPAIAGLSANAIHALSDLQAAALTAPQIQMLSGKQLDAFTVAALNAATLTNLSKAQFSGLTAAAIARFSIVQFDAEISPHLGWLAPIQIADLTTGQIASLTGADVATLQAAVLGALSTAQFDALSSEAIATLSAKQLAYIGAAPLNGLSSAQLGGLDVQGLSARTIAHLTATTLNALTPLQFTEFSRTQVGALTSAEIAELSDINLDALNVLYFGPAQIAGLSANYIGSLSVLTFDEAIARYVGHLTPRAISGLTIAEIESMTPGQVGAISVRQFEALSSCQQLAVLEGAPLIAEAKSLEVKGALTYSGMLQVLQSAALRGMNAIKFGELKLLASELNADCGIETSAYVEQIARDVIDGNSANAYWHGGAATASALGDLTASSSQVQMDELIGKWFLGTDLPSISIPDSVGYPVPGEYQAVSLPLFGPGGPSYLDVSQGNVGDGYFLAALAETAYTDPKLIENMMHENPNGTYSVGFEVDGEADYVTVNDELPIMLDGYQAANGSILEFANSPYAWSLLIEKAYVELTEQKGVAPGSVLGVNGNAYADTAGGGGNGISVITGDCTDWCGLVSGESATDLGSIASTLQSELSAHLDVLFASSSLRSGIGNLVNNQMFEVLQVSVAKQLVLLQNPWNGSGEGSGKQMEFWESLSQLAMDSNGPADPAGFYLAKTASPS